MLMIAGAIRPKTSNVLAMSEMMPRLVGAKLEVRPNDVDIVSDSESHSMPKAWRNGHL